MRWFLAISSSHSGVVCQSWSLVPYLPSRFQLKRFTRYMSAIGALETVALTQVYRHGPTLPVSDYPNLSATTIVRLMTGKRRMLCRVRLMADESSNCVGFQRGTPSNQGQTTEDDSSHDYRTWCQPSGSAASPCNACAGAALAGCCNDTSTACAGWSGAKESACLSLRAAPAAGACTRVVPAAKSCKINSARSAFDRVMVLVSTLRAVHA